MDIHELMEYNKRLFAIQEQKADMLNVLKDVSKEYGKAKGNVRDKLREHFKEAQDNTKKSAGIEILELYVCNKCPEIAQDYKTYIELDSERKFLIQAVESLNQDESAIQSEMKYQGIAGG